jgi:death-on-curing family protein
MKSFYRTQIIAKMTFSPVLQLFTKITSKLFRLVVGKDTLWATPEHLFKTVTNHWVPARALTLGTMLMLANQSCAISSILEKDTIAKVYNFEVEQTNTYTVGYSNIIVHNDCSWFGSLSLTGANMEDLLELGRTYPDFIERMKIVFGNSNTSIDAFMDFLRKNPTYLDKFNTQGLSIRAWEALRISKSTFLTGTPTLAVIQNLSLLVNKMNLTDVADIQLIYSRLDPKEAQLSVLRTLLDKMTTADNMGIPAILSDLRLGGKNQQAANAVLRAILNGAGDWVKFLDDPLKASQFADEIVEINRATEGGGTLLSGTPSSAINTASYYSTIPEQGSSIFKTIIKNHMFADGNKRTAVNMFKSFCSKSGITTSLTDAQMMEVATKVATNQIDDVLEISQQLIK